MHELQGLRARCLSQAGVCALRGPPVGAASVLVLGDVPLLRGMVDSSESRCGHLPNLWDLPVPHSLSKYREFCMYRQRSAGEEEPVLLATAHGEMHLQVSPLAGPALMHESHLVCV